MLHIMAEFERAFMEKVKLPVAARRSRIWIRYKRLTCNQRRRNLLTSNWSVKRSELWTSSFTFLETSAPAVVWASSLEEGARACNGRFQNGTCPFLVGFSSTRRSQRFGAHEVRANLLFKRFHSYNDALMRLKFKTTWKEYMLALRWS